jgi:hypothetical protein
MTQNLSFSSLTALIGSLTLSALVHAETPSANDQARFLAGIPQEQGSPLADLARRPEYERHAKEFDTSWADIEKRQLGPIRDWMRQTLPAVVQDTSPLLYVFSGPDFLHASTFYPNASTYVLCGIEPVGLPPDVTQLGSDSLDASLRNLRESLNAVAQLQLLHHLQHEERPLRQRHAAQRHPARALRLPRPLRLLHRVRRKRRPRP